MKLVAVSGEIKNVVKLSSILGWLVIVAAAVMILNDAGDGIKEMIVYSVIIPILIASFFYGRIGGLIVAFLASLIGGSLAVGEPEVLSSPVVHRVMFQILLFNILALVTSTIADREKDAKHKYMSLFEGVPIGLFRFSQEGKITDVNSAMVEMLGYPEESKLLDMHMSALTLSVKDLDLWLAKIRREGVVHGELMLFRKHDGSVIWTESTCRIVKDFNGQIMYYDGSLVDVTKRTLAEEKLRLLNEDLEQRVLKRTAELEETNNKLKKSIDKAHLYAKKADSATKAKSEFLANMSHEIRTPLNGIIAATELVLGLEASPKMAQYLKIIQTSSYSLLNIINDILDFSKIEAGKIELEQRAFNTEEAIEAATEMFIGKASEKNLEILVDIDTDIPVELVGDQFRLGQVLANLLGNAVKFTEKSGVITVSADLVKKSRDEIFLKFTVQDTGIGISQDHLKKLFHPFTQADTSMSRKFGGTGLGLCICKKLVELMDGLIWAESEIGKGSRFIFTARFGKASDESGKPRFFPRDLAGLKVLLADESIARRRLIRKILLSFGFTVEETGSGRETISKIKDGSADEPEYGLLIMDCRLSDPDIIETATAVRKEIEDATPIILSNVYENDMWITEMKEPFFNAVLPKPVMPSTLFDCIMEVFGKTPATTRKRKHPMKIRTALYKKSLKGMKVLLAEDNQTNQEITVALLEEVGVKADIAASGKEAVNAVSRKQYDVVLMDVQMPEMDGYEATRVIRENNPPDVLPIIAMTANAMRGDKEKCLEAGMNRYIPKPVNQGILYRTLHAFAGDRQDDLDIETLRQEAAQAPESVRRPDAPSCPDIPGVDVNDALRRLGVDYKSYINILSGFLGRNRDIIDQFKTACSVNDMETLRRLAHSLKGSAQNIGADKIGESASVIERMAEESRIESLEILLDEIESQLERINAGVGLIREGNESHEIRRPSEFEPGDESETIGTILSNLAKSLKNADPVEIEKLLRKAERHVDSSQLYELKETINEYDYDGAGEMVHKISATLQE